MRQTYPGLERPRPKGYDEAAYERNRDRQIHERPNIPAAKDDIQKGDISARDATRLGASVMKVREHSGFTLESFMPNGFWRIKGLENLGTFVTQAEAERAIEKHSKDKK